MWPFLIPVLTRFLTVACPLYAIARNLIFPGMASSGENTRPPTTDSGKHILLGGEVTVRGVSLTCHCHSCVPTPAHSPSQGDQVGPISPLPLPCEGPVGLRWSSSHRGRPSPPRKSQLSPQPDLLTASILAPGTSGRTMVRGLETRGSVKAPKSVAPKTRSLSCSLSGPVSGCARALWGALGLDLHAEGLRPPGDSLHPLRSAKLSDLSGRGSVNSTT